MNIKKLYVLDVLITTPSTPVPLEYCVWGGGGTLGFISHQDLPID